MSSSKLEYKDLTSYITSLPKAIIEKIFDHPTTCLAIFRELPELSKIFVMRLLLVNQEVPQTTINSWVNSLYQKKSAEATQVLANLGVWQEVKIQGGMSAWVLKTTFKNNLYSAIFGSDDSGRLKVVNDKTEGEGIETKLDNYANERWEAVLKYIVSPKENINSTSISTKEILKFSGLMKTPDESNDNGDAILTASAFQFLLWNRRVQVWYFIIQLLEYSQKNGQDISECLSLLFELSFSTFGKAYSCENFSPTKEYFLQELRTIGLVSRKTRKENKFYPTRLAIQLANGLKEIDEANMNENGFIVLETNYRIYAYTDSKLKISLIALFAELMYKFPNMVVGVLTRDSVREAFQMGITAQQIISFLRANAHPQCFTKKPILPETVTDQINIWQNERNRFKFTESVVYSQFGSEDDYQLIKQYANDLGAIIWLNDAKRILIVKKSAHDSVKKYWKQNKPG